MTADAVRGLRELAAREWRFDQAEFIVALCDSWLAQQAVVDAAAALDDIVTATGRTSRGLMLDLHRALAALDSASPAPPSGGQG